MEEIAKVFVADCHIRSGSEKENEFRGLLSALSALPEHCQVIFLGDIFDLWIAHSAYEDELHRDFLQWCREEKKRRKIVFIEGNHELYVKKRYSEYFTFVSGSEYQEGTVCYCHGDQFNDRDYGYRFFRFLLRNEVMCFLAFLTGWGLGPFVARIVKKIFCCKGTKEERPLPREILERFMETLQTRCLTEAVAGHFHRPAVLKTASGAELYLVPAWEVRGEIALQFSDGRYENILWKRLSGEEKKESEGSSEG